jgi:hypothetical protein
MKIRFKLNHFTPTIELSELDGQTIEIGMSIYDHDPMCRLHDLFLSLKYLWLGYSAEEFEDEGVESAIAFRPADDPDYTLMTVEQASNAPGQAALLVKDYRVAIEEIEKAYKQAFQSFIIGLSEDKLQELNEHDGLALDDFWELTKKPSDR